MGVVGTRWGTQVCGDRAGEQAGLPTAACVRCFPCLARGGALPGWLMPQPAAAAPPLLTAEDGWLTFADMRMSDAGCINAQRSRGIAEVDRLVRYTLGKQRYHRPLDDRCGPGPSQQPLRCKGGEGARCRAAVAWRRPTNPWHTVLRRSATLNPPAEHRTALVKDTGWLSGAAVESHWRLVNTTFTCTGNLTHPLPEGEQLQRMRPTRLQDAQPHMPPGALPFGRPTVYEAVVGRQAVSEAPPDPPPPPADFVDLEFWHLSPALLASGAAALLLLAGMLVWCARVRGAAVGCPNSSSGRLRRCRKPGPSCTAPC